MKGCLGFGLTLALASPVSAATLSYRAPGECADADNVQEQAERLIGRPLADTDDVDFTVTVDQSVAPAWHATLIARQPGESEPASREFSGASCAEVTDAVAVVMAMTIEQQSQPSDEVEGDSSNAAATRVTESPPATAVAGGGAQRAAPSTPPSSSRPPGFRARAALLGVLDAGALPSPTPAAELDVMLGTAKVYAVLVGSVSVSQSKRLPDGKGGEFQLQLGGLLGCGERAMGVLRAEGCAGLEIGQITARGVGVSEPRAGSASWRAGRVDVGLRWPLSGGISLAARGALVAPLARQYFVLDGSERVYRPAALAVRGLLGLDLEI